MTGYHLISRKKTSKSTNTICGCATEELKITTKLKIERSRRYLAAAKEHFPISTMPLKNIVIKKISVYQLRQLTGEFSKEY